MSRETGDNETTKYLSLVDTNCTDNRRGGQQHASSMERTSGYEIPTPLPGALPRDSFGMYLTADEKNGSLHPSPRDTVMGPSPYYQPPYAAGSYLVGRNDAQHRPGPLPPIPIEDRFYKRLGLPEDTSKPKPRPCCTCNKTILALFITLLVAGACGGVAYGIYYAVTTLNNSSTATPRPVVIYGQLLYANISQVIDANRTTFTFAENFKSKMAAAWAQSLVPTYYSSCDVSGVTRLPPPVTVQFFVNLLNLPQNNRTGLFDLVKNVIVGAFVTDTPPTVTLGCLTVIPEAYVNNTASYTCTFNLTQVTY